MFKLKAVFDNEVKLHFFAEFFEELGVILNDYLSIHGTEHNGWKLGVFTSISGEVISQVVMRHGRQGKYRGKSSIPRRERQRNMLYVHFIFYVTRSFA
jgi:hypothetical protein